MTDREFELAKATAALEAASRVYSEKGREVSSWSVTSAADEFYNWIEGKTGA